MRRPRYLAKGEPITEGWLKELVDYVRAGELQPGPGYLCNRSPGGTTLSIARRSGAGGSALAESWDLALSGATAVVAPGTLRLHGIGKYATGETTLTLTGDADWIYVKHLRDHSATTIEHQATEPVSDATALRIPLYECTALAAGVYSARSCRGDINMGSPL